MNKRQQIMITLTLTAATTLAHAARMEDVMDIPKPDIQQEAERYDAEASNRVDLRVDLRRVDQQSLPRANTTPRSVPASNLDPLPRVDPTKTRLGR